MASIMNNINHSDDTMLHESELLLAFEAQKVVNRQLESELTALTEENNSKILDLTQEIDELRLERSQFQEVLHNQIRSMDSTEDSNHSSIPEINSSTQKQQNLDYLFREVKSISAAYAQVLVRLFFKF